MIKNNRLRIFHEEDIFMRKIVQILIIVSLVLALSFALSACEVKLPSDASEATLTPTPVVSSEATDATPSPTPSQDVATATPTATPSPTMTPDPDLQAILQKITMMEEGTAGSSLRRAAISGEFLDWIEDSSLSQSAIEYQISVYLDSLPNQASIDLFDMNFDMAAVDVQLIIDGNSSMLGMLLDSGYTLGHAAYTQSKWDTFTEAVQVAMAAY
jgi:hypothetical protein